MHAPVTPEPSRLPLALLAEPLPGSVWVQAELRVGKKDAEITVGAFMCPDSGRPGCWTPAGPIGVERLDPDEEWAIVSNPAVADDAFSVLVDHAWAQHGDSGTR